MIQGGNDVIIIQIKYTINVKKKKERKSQNTRWYEYKSRKSKKTNWEKKKQLTETNKKFQSGWQLQDKCIVFIL